MAGKRNNPLAARLEREARKKAKVEKETDELDLTTSADGAALALLMSVEILIDRANVIERRSKLGQENPEDNESYVRELQTVATGVSDITRRRQPGNLMTDLPSPEERIALTELLRKVEVVIAEHKAGKLSAENIAQLAFEIKNLAIIDVEEGMDSALVPDWVPEESIDQRLANLSLGNTRQSMVSEAELKAAEGIESKFKESDKEIPNITPPESNWNSFREHLDSWPERRARYKVQGGESDIAQGTLVDD